tara:strand:+ start:86 stop:652 length:567 start_codon:yes stop_codon:yes gene_type:complete
MIPETFAGYPVYVEKTPWYKRHPHVSGMAAGGKFDATGTKSPYISINGYSESMKRPRARDNLLRIEASRHLMRETGYKTDWELTPEQKEFQMSFRDYGKAGEAYANNLENSFNETLISRSVGYPLDMGDERYYTWDAQVKIDPVTKKIYNDESITPPKLTDEQIKDVNMFDQMIFNRELVSKVKRGEL